MGVLMLAPDHLTPMREKAFGGHRTRAIVLNPLWQLRP